MEEKKQILAVFAHPDDEAFGTGGSLAHFASQGHAVFLVCATRGEVGEISDPELATPETLGQVREGELRCASETMGIQEPIFLGYRDSGMLNSPENQDPRALIQAPARAVQRQLVQIIRRIRPDIILTFEPNGGYGHPDHIAIHKHTVAAFHAAADPNQYREYQPAWQAERLFYTAIPQSFFTWMIQQLKLTGEDTSGLEAFQESGLTWPDEQVHLILDVSDQIEAKWEAFHCHRTQFGPSNFFRRLPEAQVKQMIGKEHFALAWPEPKPGLHLESIFSDFSAE
jgi:LmbE family N-acetylglucosaminyl deacetylase